MARVLFELTFAFSFAIFLAVAVSAQSPTPPQWVFFGIKNDNASYCTGQCWWGYTSNIACTQGALLYAADKRLSYVPHCKYFDRGEMAALERKSG